MKCFLLLSFCLSFPCGEQVHASVSSHLRADATTTTHSGWKQSSWLGKFFDSGSNWIYHEWLGWLYPVDSGSDATWFYHADLKWIWTKKSLFPFFFVNGIQDWSYFNRDHGLYDFATKQYVSQSSFLTDNWRRRLYTPTYINQIGDLYVIVDCWHHRIIYSKSIDANIEDWDVLDDDVAGPHSFATDGEILIYEDTGRGKLKVALFKEGDLQIIQIVSNVGIRPHRVIYHETAESFFVISSGDQALYEIKKQNKTAAIFNRVDLNFLKKSYSRSISMIDGNLYFTSGGGYIFKTKYQNREVKVIESYSVPDGFENMNDIFKSKTGWYYFSSTSGSRIARSRSISAFSKGDFEDIASEFGLSGTPYYMSEFGGRVYLPEITQHSGIIWFKEDSLGKVIEHGKLFEFGPPNSQDIARRNLWPL